MSNAKRLGLPIFATFAITFLANCGGGSGVTSASTQNFVGVAALTGTDPRVVDLIETTATEEANTLTIDIDGYDYAADSGFDSGRAVENGAAAGSLTREVLPTDTDMVLYAGFYSDGGVGSAVYYGLLGEAVEDTVPTSGNASWVGNGFAQIETNGGKEDLFIGRSEVSATFGGEVDANITNLSGSVDAIDVLGMTIADDRFSGGTITTFKNGAEFDVTGANTTAITNGIFSGETVNDAPDEVGALFTLTGDDATIIGGFVAD